MRRCKSVSIHCVKLHLAPLSTLLGYPAGLLVLCLLFTCQPHQVFRCYSCWCRIRRWMNPHRPRRRLPGVPRTPRHTHAAQVLTRDDRHQFRIQWLDSVSHFAGGQGKPFVGNQLGVFEADFAANGRTEHTVLETPTRYIPHFHGALFVPMVAFPIAHRIFERPTGEGTPRLHRCQGLVAHDVTAPRHAQLIAIIAIVSTTGEHPAPCLLAQPLGRCSNGEASESGSLSKLASVAPSPAVRRTVTPSKTCDAKA